MQRDSPSVSCDPFSNDALERNEWELSADDSSMMDEAMKALTETFSQNNRGECRSVLRVGDAEIDVVTTLVANRREWRIHSRASLDDSLESGYPVEQRVRRTQREGLDAKAESAELRSAARQAARVHLKQILTLRAHTTKQPPTMRWPLIVAVVFALCGLGAGLAYWNYGQSTVVPLLNGKPADDNTGDLQPGRVKPSKRPAEAECGDDGGLEATIRCKFNSDK